MQLLNIFKNKNCVFYNIEINNELFLIKQVKNLEYSILLENEIKYYHFIKKLSFVPKIYQYSLDGNYIIYEYIEGYSFDKIESDNISEKIKYFYEILLALEQLHELNLVHCDLKQSNIMIDKNNIVYLIDYGNMKKVGEITQFGTKKFCSLEQLYKKDVTIQFDLYALGIMLYEVFEKLTIFDNLNTKELIEKKKEKLILSNVPDLVNEIIYKATNKGYNSVVEMRKDLEKLLISNY